MTERILIMGLPGSGKTTLAATLKQCLEDHAVSVEWVNADAIRKQFNDWDFSIDGRIRQSHRMRQIADSSTAVYIVCDFVAPLSEMREIFDADWTIWMDTIDSGRYADTNSIFTPPNSYDFRVVEKDAVKWSKLIVDRILSLL